MWGLLLYVLCWDLGWAGMMLVVAAAVLPASVRGVGLGACWSCLWLCIFTISQSFGWAVDTCAAASLPPAASLPCLARDPPSPPHTSLATPHVDSAPPCPLPGWACPGSSASSPPAASPPSSSSACACPATRGWGTARRRRGGESRRASPTHRRAWPAGGARRYYSRGATAAWAPCSDRTQRSVPIPTAAAAASIITARESVYRIDYGIDVGVCALVITINYGVLRGLLIKGTALSLPRDGCVGEPLEAKRLPTCTGSTRRLWGWLGRAWVASSELEL